MARHYLYKYWPDCLKDMCLNLLNTGDHNDVYGVAEQVSGKLYINIWVEVKELLDNGDYLLTLTPV